MHFDCYDDPMYVKEKHIPQNCATCTEKLTNTNKSEFVTCKFTGTAVSKDMERHTTNGSCPLCSVEIHDKLVRQDALYDALDIIQDEINIAQRCGVIDLKTNSYVKKMLTRITQLIKQGTDNEKI